MSVKIGNIDVGEFPLLLAPMEDVSDPPFREGDITITVFSGTYYLQTAVEIQIMK